MGRKKKNSSFDPRKSHQYKEIKCRTENCQRMVKVDAESKSALCWRCLASKIPAPPDRSSATTKSSRPRGWALRKLFVDKNGSVFHKGIEQPKLKGTLPPTKVEKKKTKRKKKQETEAQKQSRLLKRYKEKKKILKG